METKPEKKTKTTTIIVTTDLLRQLHTPSSASKEGLKTNNEGNKNNVFNAQTTRSSSKNQKGEKKKTKKIEKKEGKSQVDFRCEKSRSATKKAPKKITEMGRKTEHLPP
jgi:hypothetical protein